MEEKEQRLEIQGVLRKSVSIQKQRTGSKMSNRSKFGMSDEQKKRQEEI